MKIFWTLCLFKLSTTLYFSRAVAQIQRVDLFEGSLCKLKTGGDGICTKTADCAPVINEFRQGNYNNKVTCLFDGFVEIVCCPLAETGNKLGVSPAELACSQYENEISNSVEELNFHVLNGIAAVDGEFPYLAALGYRKGGNDENVIEYTCGGTLISPQYVLTAAHCVTNYNERVPVQVKLGSAHLYTQSANVQEIQIKRVISHPKYARSNGLYDIALLQLENSVRWTSYVQPICLQTKALETGKAAVNDTYVVAGWGATGFDAGRSKNLLKTPPLTLLSSKDCEPFYTPSSQFPDGLGNHSICAQDPNRSRRSDACLGDSGGPLLHITAEGDTVVGVTSFGRFCGSTVPGGYMSVFSFLNWIEKIVWP